MTEETAMRTCTKCGIEYSIDNFYKKSSHKDGISPWCKGCSNICTKNWIERNPTYYKEEYEKRGNTYTGREEWYKEYYLETKEKHKENYDRFRKSDKGRESHRKSEAKKRANDLNYRISTLLRTDICNRLSSSNATKKDKTDALLGCSITFLIKYIESQFVDGMSWDNHNRNGWHIDHIRPCASFDLSKEEEQRECFHYTNLQPLWAIDNLRKGAKIIA